MLLKYFKYFKNDRVKINLIDTGKNTMTGGRLKRMSRFLKIKLLATYGDGLSNVNLHNLVKFHKLNKIGHTYRCEAPSKIWNNKIERKQSFLF